MDTRKKEVSKRCPLQAAPHPEHGGGSRSSSVSGRWVGAGGLRGPSILPRGDTPPPPRPPWRRPGLSAGWRRAPGNGGSGPASPAGAGRTGTPPPPTTTTPRARCPPASPPACIFLQQGRSRSVLKNTSTSGFFAPLPGEEGGGGHDTRLIPTISKAPLFGSRVIPADKAGHACFLPRN